MSEIKNVGYTWMAKCNQLTSLPFKGFKYSLRTLDCGQPQVELITLYTKKSHEQVELEDDDKALRHVHWKPGGLGLQPQVFLKG